MTVQVNYKTNIKSKISNNLVLFTEENFNIKQLKKYTSNSEFTYINEILKTSNLKKNLLIFDINSKKK